jgi:hypothetical protein
MTEWTQAEMAAFAARFGLARLAPELKLMGWTAPAERHRVPDVVVVGRRHRRGAVRHAGYHHRS